MRKTEARTQHLLISSVVKKFLYNVPVIGRSGGQDGQSVDEMINYYTDKKKSVIKDLII